MRVRYIVLVVVAISILWFALQMSVFTPKFNSDWLTCQSDVDCIFVESYGPCSCGEPFVINGDFNDSYNSFSSKSLFVESFIWVRYECSICIRFGEFIPVCENNECSGKEICIPYGRPFPNLSNISLPCCEGLNEVQYINPDWDEQNLSVCIRCGDDRCIGPEDKNNCPKDCS
ncbi:hypothetical protein GOV09_04105 [Candidatus Woesearchaeota archaeon]|nr:hypothetical protein [Candidatus Woesearchaeota archaeon]